MTIFGKERMQVSKLGSLPFNWFFKAINLLFFSITSSLLASVLH